MVRRTFPEAEVWDAACVVLTDLADKSLGDPQSYRLYEALLKHYTREGASRDMMTDRVREYQRNPKPADTEDHSGTN